MRSDRALLRPELRRGVCSAAAIQGRRISRGRLRRLLAQALTDSTPMMMYLPALDWLKKAGRLGVAMVERAGMARGSRKAADVSRPRAALVGERLLGSWSLKRARQADARRAFLGSAVVGVFGGRRRSLLCASCFVSLAIVLWGERVVAIVVPLQAGAGQCSWM